MADSPNTDRTRTIAWHAAATPAHLAECQKLALQHQQELLQDAQQRLAAWAKRRQTALETGIEALTRMSTCKTPVEAAAICSEWMSGSITRMIADFDDAQAHAARMSEEIQKASRDLFEAQQASAAKVPAIFQPTLSEVPAREQLRDAAD